MTAVALQLSPPAAPVLPQLPSPMADSMSSVRLQYMTEGRFNWRMMKTIFTELHLYDEDANYIAFDWEKEDKLLAFQRKFLPEFFRSEAARISSV